VQELVTDGRQTEAIQELEKLVVRYPDYALAYNDLGVLYFREGEKKKALEHYERAAQLEPENATFQKNLADFYCIEMGELENGLKIYLRVLEDNPTDIETLLTLGDICVSLGKMEDARVFYDRVLELEPWNMDAGEKLDALSCNNLIG
jgi:Flp pilus assembly protein TadD